MSVWRVIWRRGLWNVNEKERWRNERERKSGVGLGWKEDVCGRSMWRVEEANEWFVSKERLSGGGVWE